MLLVTSLLLLDHNVFGLGDKTAIEALELQVNESDVDGIGALVERLASFPALTHITISSRQMPTYNARCLYIEQLMATKPHLFRRNPDYAEELHTFCEDKLADEQDNAVAVDEALDDWLRGGHQRGETLLPRLNSRALIQLGEQNQRGSPRCRPVEGREYDFFQKVERELF